MAARDGRSRPLLVSFGAWLESESETVLPKSPVGEAIAYARSNWAALTRYSEAPYLAIDNNAVENAIRPIALGATWADALQSWLLFLKYLDGLEQDRANEVAL